MRSSFFALGSLLNSIIIVMTWYKNKRRDIFRGESMILKFHMPPPAEGLGPRDIDSPAKFRKKSKKLEGLGTPELNRLLVK